MQEAVFYSVSIQRDVRRGTTPVPFSAYQGSRTAWRVGVLKPDGTLDDLSDVESMQLSIVSYGGATPGSVAWIRKETDEFLTPDSAEAVLAKLEWHAEFIIPGSEFLLPVEDDGSRQYWYEIKAILTGGDSSILAAGVLVVIGTSQIRGDAASSGDLLAESNARQAADAGISSRVTDNEESISLLDERTGTAEEAIAALETGAAATNESVTALGERIDITDSEVAETGQRATVLEGQVGDLTSTVQGMQVGDSYRVANLSSLPGTVNATGATRFAEVYNDSVSDDNNGRYYNENGSSVWAKVDGDTTGRIVNLEDVTSPFSISLTPRVLPDGRVLLLSIRDLAGRVAAGVLDTGILYSFHDHAAATPSAAGFMSTAHVAKLEPIATSRKLYAGTSEVLWTVRDPSGRMPIYTTDNGVTHIMLADIRELVNTLSVPSIVIGGSSIKVRTDIRGWQFLIVDAFRRIGAGIRDDGSAYLPGLEIPGQEPGSITNEMLAPEAVATPNLDLTLRRNNAQDYAQVMPDGARKQNSQIGVMTMQNWHRLPDRVTPSLLAVVPSDGATVEFRKDNGLNVRGMRYRGTWSPGAVPSTTVRGQITATSTWPPAGTPAVGDFHVFTPVGATRVIGSDTLRQGDNMVWSGSAWVYQAAPAVKPDIAELDFWEVSEDGTFAEVVVKAGERFCYIGYNSISGVGWLRWRVGQPSWGEYFRMGEFNPASGLPSSPKEGDMWEASAGGTAGGFTFSTGDTLVRKSGVWIPIKEEASKPCAAGAGIHLPCIRSSREWCVRRADKALSPQISIEFGGYTGVVPVIGKADIAGYSDSLGGQPFSILQELFTDRSVAAHAYGGANPKDIMAMMEYWISLGDPEMSKMHVIFQGRNAIANLALIQEMADRMGNLVGAANRRLLFMTPGAQRAVSWNAGLGRYVIANMEEQLVESSTNIYARAYRYFRDNWKYNYLDTRAILCAAARSDYFSLEHPGMTERQVADQFGIWPIRFQRDIDIDGLDFTAISHKGNWTLAGLPTGGSPNDVYMRLSNGIPIANILGTWKNIGLNGSNYDGTHLSETGDTGLPAGMKGGDNVLAEAIHDRVILINY